jgi:hypothetical protein
MRSSAAQGFSRSHTCWPLISLGHNPLVMFECSTERERLRKTIRCTATVNHGRNDTEKENVSTFRARVFENSFWDDSGPASD